MTKSAGDYAGVCKEVRRRNTIVQKMVETNDPAEAQRLKEQIVAGFFGKRPKGKLNV